jgi:hypothetical protein
MLDEVAGAGWPVINKGRGPTAGGPMRVVEDPHHRGLIPDGSGRFSTEPEFHVGNGRLTLAAPAARSAEFLLRFSRTPGIARPGSKLR